VTRPLPAIIDVECHHRGLPDCHRLIHRQLVLTDASADDDFIYSVRDATYGQLKLRWPMPFHSAALNLLASGGNRSI
jgi:hypothetical protein